MRFCTNCGTEIGTSTRPASAQPRSNWSAAAAPARIKPEAATELSGNPGPDPDRDEVTHVLGSQGQTATVPGDPGARAAASQIGRIIEGKYRLDAVIGAGGMGSVYRAHRLLIGDPVAIKLLHHEHVSEAEGSERFRNEAKAAARLKHPNAVSIYDFGVTNDGLIYLVMELVEGQSLRRVIKEQGPLRPAVAADIINQACAALDEAHRQQIVHRDLKPDNIIVNQKFTGLQVKVLDFGIAKLRDVTASNLTQADSIMGTPHYMSPEQCLGEELDNRSDIYSLGIVLYEMLAGVVPFNSPNSTAVVVQHVNQAPPPLRGSTPGISAAVERAVMHALAKRREDRPQSARALAAEFSAAVDASLPLTVESPTPRSDVAVTAVNPTFVIAPRPTGSGPRQPYAEVVPSPQPRNRYLIPSILVGALLLALGVIAGLLIDANNKKKESANPVTVSTPSARNGNTADNQTVDQSSSISKPDRSPASTSESIPSPAPRVVQNPPPSNTGLDYSFRRNYQGTIAGRALLFTLVKTGSTVDGRAETTGTNASWDQLHGPIEPNGSFTLWGSDHGGEVTGKYTGQLLPNGTVQNGFYESIKTGKRIPFFLR